MRLIDADLLVNELNKRVRTPRSTMEIIRDIIPFIEMQETVYDIDKVIEQLKTDSSVKLYGSGNSNNYLISLEKAIEIIKAGGNF